MLHMLFGTQLPDSAGNRWENGLFVTKCMICGKAMVKPAGGQWQLIRTRR